MANTETFVGRENEILKFREEMGKLYPKKGILQKWLWKKEEAVSSKKVFLFFGDGGFGKTTLLEKFIKEAKDVAKLHKEELVDLKISWDSYHREKSTLPNTGEKMLHAIFETITTVYKKGNFPKYMKMREDAKKAQEKAESQSKNLFDSESMKKMGMTAIGLADV